MGMRDDIQTDIALAFDTDLADAVHAFTYKQWVRNDYDPATGTSGDFVPEPWPTSRGVFDQFTHMELMNSAVEASDVKLIVLQNELSVTPDISDYVVDATDGREYRVEGKMKDPADATWILQIRAQS